MTVLPLPDIPAPDVANSYSALGVVVLMIVFGIMLAWWFFRDRREERKATLQIRLAEQETLRLRDADTRKREEEFFDSIGKIGTVADSMARLADTNEALAQATREQNQTTSVHNADESTRNAEMVNALREIAGFLQSLGTNYQTLSASYQTLETKQATSDNTVSQLAHEARNMFAKVKRQSGLIKKIHEIVVRIDEKLSPQLPITSHDTVIETDADKDPFDKKPEEATHETVPNVIPVSNVDATPSVGILGNPHHESE